MSCSSLLVWGKLLEMGKESKEKGDLLHVKLLHMHANAGLVPSSRKGSIAHYINITIPFTHTERFIIWTFCFVQYVVFFSYQTIGTSRVKNVTHCDVLHPRSVTKMHHPPCCSLCTPSIHPSSMPISASCDLLPSNLMATPTLHHLSFPPHWSTSFFPLSHFPLSFVFPPNTATTVLIFSPLPS